MTTQVHNTTRLGDLVVAAFDQAALYTSDSEELRRLAARAVMRFWRRRRRRRFQYDGVPGGSQ